MAKEVIGLSLRRLGFNPRQPMWDLWWIKWQCDRFFSEYFGFLCQYQYTYDTHSFPHIAPVLHNSSNVQHH